jgi:hypothetical protein
MVCLVQSEKLERFAPKPLVFAKRVAAEGGTIQSVRSAGPKLKAML